MDEMKYCPYCMNPVEPGEPCPSCGLTAGAYAPSPHHLPPGTVLRERYLIGRVLGEGGFGITYIGCDLRLELKVAIKEYFPTDRANRVARASTEVSSYSGAAGERYEAGKTRFLQEARAMARMDKQPVIVGVRDFFELNNTAYIVMEYVEGTTFKDLVAQRGGRVPAGELLHVMEPLFSALSAMHRQGLIHRDISPENLMLENGDVRLLDFGCARESAEGEVTMTIALKHGYAPVEQYQNKGQGPWTDVYALSATMYYCLTGRKPPQSMDRLVEDELVLPRKLGVDLTLRQERALIYGMGVRPRRRFQSVEELHAALYEGVLPEGMDPGPEPPAAAQEKPDGIGVTKPGEPPAQAVPAEQPQTQTQSRTPIQAQPEPIPASEPDWLRWLKAHWPAAAGTGAAVLLIALLVWRPWAGGPAVDDLPPAHTAAGTPGAEDTDSPSRARTPAPIDLTFSQDKSEEENGAVLLALLEDDSVDSVAVPGTVGVRVAEPVTLTKPLRIGPGNMNTVFSLPLTVAAGGRLEVAGSVDCNTLLRCVDGGTVSVEEGAQLGGANVWLERADDLAAAPGANVNYWGENSTDPDPFEKTHRLTLDEEALFAGAVHVSGEEEFAGNLQGTKPIIIDGEVTLSQWYEAYVPILVPEGSVLSAPCDEGGADCTLDVVGQTVVNRGTVRGRVSLIGNYEDAGKVPVLVNYGQVDGCLNTYEGPSAVVNLGGIAFAGSAVGAPEVCDANLINLGQITAVPGGGMEIRGNSLENCGAFTVPGGAAVNLAVNVNNQGELAVERGGTLAVTQYLHNGEAGTVLTRSGGTLEVPGLLEIEAGRVSVEAGGALDNSGVIQYGADTLELAEGASITGDGHRIPFSFYDPAVSTDAVRFVENERDLRQALVNPSVQVVVWHASHDGNWIDLTGGDLTVDKGLVLQNFGPQTQALRGANITVTGENAFAILNTLDFGGGALRVEQGATARLVGQNTNLGGLTAADGGLICATQSDAYVRDGQMSATGGGRIVNASGMNLTNCRVDVGEGSRLYSSGGMDLADCAVTIDGELVCAVWLEMPTGSFANNGLANLSGGCYLGGTTTNSGTMHLAVGDLNGELVNVPGAQILLHGGDGLNLRGTLDNQGEIKSLDGGEIHAVDGGRITGNLIMFGE